ncbi:MAG: lipocalin-like domain-containing protein, partial [Vicinamibacterales bacterium]
GGQLNAGSIPVFKRYYEFVGNQLILIPGDNGLTKEKATSRLIWERMPDAPLSAEARKFVGTYRLQYTDRYTVKDGKETADGARTDARAGSVIIYTRSGHMMVHLRDKAGRQKYAGQTPTPEEALAAYRTYVGYFGTFDVKEGTNPAYLFHNLEGSLNPAMGPQLQRFYQFAGNVLRLATAPTTAAGKTTGGYLYWERLPAAR